MTNSESDARASKENALVEGEKFTTAWLNIDKFPGGMMMSSHGGRFGPVPAMTGCLITTSATTVEEWRLKGMSVIEVQLRNAPETPELRFHEGERQSYLKAVELSVASGMLGDGDKSDLLDMYQRLWPRAPSDVRANALKANSCVCGEPNSPGTHRTDGPCLAPIGDHHP